MVVRLGQVLPDVEQPEAFAGLPDWKQANPRWIERALGAAMGRSGGGWVVLGASRDIHDKPQLVELCGDKYIAFRGAGGVIVGPRSCPHMGAPLEDGHVSSGAVVCPWHGLRLCEDRHGSWRPLVTFDDGVLVWARMDALGEEPTDRPVLPERPASFIDAIIRVEGACEPEDVVANRLDPWHGTHFHPYAFAELRVIDASDDAVTVRVAKRVLGPAAVEVDARFHSPDRRTIVMTIVAGEGQGSVVETHATPLGPGRTAVIEASLATSDRRAFTAARLLAPVTRHFMNRSAKRLWIDDIAYAERRYAVRTGG